MSPTRRLIAVISLVVAGLGAFSATTIAFDLRSPVRASILRQPTDLLAAGVYHNSNTNAGFFTCCGADGGTQMMFSVAHLESTANPSVGPSTSSDEVDVSFSISDFFTGAFQSVCFVADRLSDFTVNQMLSFAQLNTNVLGSTKTCGGGFIGVSPPFNITATFSMAASVGQSISSSTYTCGAYSATTQGKGSGSSNGFATFSASFLGGPALSVFGADLFSSDQTIHVQGIAPDGCISIGGKGAGGPGAQAPGDYHNSSMSVNMSVQPDDPTQQPFSIFAISFMSTAHPVGRPVSTQSETDVNVFQFSFFNFIRDCWVITPADLSIASDLHTASLNVPATEAVGQCQGAINTGPSIQGMNAVWTPSSLVATFSNSGHGCHLSSTTLETAASATALGSWPGVAASIDDANAFIQTNVTTTHVTPGGC